MLKNLVSDEMKELIENVKTAAEEDIPLENPGEETRYPGAFSELMPLEDALKGLHGTEDIKELMEKKSVQNAAHALKDLTSDDVKDLIELVKTAAEEDIPLENPGEETRYPGAFSELMPLMDALKGLHGTEDVRKVTERPEVQNAVNAVKDLADDDIKGLIELVKTAAEEDIPLENPGEETRYPGVFSDLMPLADALKGLHASEDKKK